MAKFSYSYSVRNSETGTVRADHVGASVVKVRKNEWRRVRDIDNVSMSFRNDEVKDFRIIGVVPGSPADEDRGKVWSSAGYQQPPAHVNKVRDSEGWIAERTTDGGWLYTYDGQGRKLHTDLSAHGWSFERDQDYPLTEVKD